MTVRLPAPITCPTRSCGAQVVTLPRWDGRDVTLEARPDARGTVHVHDRPGHPTAQHLGKDACVAFREARLPLYRTHRCGGDR